MNSRRWLLPALLLLLLAGVAILPASGPGREWLLGQAVALLDDAGYTLRYDSASGSLWTGVTLRGAELSGPGLDLTLARARVDYFLPALLTGELPVSLDLRTVRGTLAIDDLAGGTSGGAGPPVSIELREVDLRDVAVDLEEVPWTLPALSVTDVEVGRTQQDFRFAGTVETDEGRASLEGSLHLEPWRLEIDIREASATLARHWWPHVTGGSLQGRLLAEGESVAADLVLTDGSLSYGGIAAAGVSGPIVLDGGLVEASLTAAEALGGPVTLEAVVNVPASSWEAELSGEPELAEVAAWLTGDEAVAETLRLTGTATTRLSASGWQRVTLRGGGVGNGTVLGMPIAGLSADFGFDSEEGTELHLTGNLAGGRLDVDMLPLDRTVTLRGELTGATPLPGVTANASLALTGDADGLAGQADLTLAGRFGDRDLDVAGDVRLDSDGVHLFVDAADDRGGTAEGAAVLAGDVLQGRLNVHDLSVPVLTGPLDLVLEANGPLDGLPLTLTVAGEGAQEPRFSGFELSRSLEGSMSGLLRGSTIEDIAGELGPVTLTGTADPSVPAASLDVTLSALDIGGRADVRLASASASLRWSSDGVALSGQADVTEAAALGIESGAFGARFDVSDGGPVTFAARRQGQGGVVAQGSWGEGGVTLELAQPPLSLSGEPLLVTGRVSLPTGGGASADLTARSMGVSLSLAPVDEGHGLEMRADAGTALGPVTLARPLEARGRLSPDATAAQLRGTLGAVDLDLRLRPSEGGARLEATVRGGDESMEIAYVPSRGALLASGTVALGPIGDALGLPVTGTLAGQLTRGADGFAGSLDVAGTVAGVPTALTLYGGGEVITTAGTARLAEEEWRLDGSLLPTVRLAATSELGALELAGTRLTGRGRLPATIGPVELSERDWTADGDLAEGRIVATVAGDRVTVDWRDGLSVSGRVEQELAVDLTGLGLPLAPGAGRLALGADLDIEWPAAGAGRFAGTLRSEAGAVDVVGDLAQVRVTGTLNAASLLEGRLVLPTADLPADAPLSVDATVSLPDAERLNAEWSLALGEQRIEGTATREGGVLEATATAPGLELDWRDGELALRAASAEIDWLLALAGVGGLPRLSVDGELGYASGAWHGRMRASGDAPSWHATLTGEGEALAIEAGLDAADYRAGVTGTVLPTLSLAVSADALGAVEARASVAGALDSPTVSGTVSVVERRLGPVRLPAQQFQLTGGVVGGEPVITLGSGRDQAILRDTGLDGRLALEFLVDRVPHRLVAELAGPLAQPSAAATVSGELISATGNLSRGSGAFELAVDLSPWLPSALAPLGPAEASVSLTGGDWRASARLPVRLLDTPSQARLDLEGTGLGYRGTASVQVESRPLLSAEVLGEGTAATVTADLSATDAEALARLLPPGIELATGGTATFDTAAGSLAVAANLRGSALGTQFELEATGSSAADVVVTGTAGRESVSARVSARGVVFGVNEPAPTASPAELLLRLAGTGPEEPGQVPGDARPVMVGALGWHDAVAFAARGGVGGHRVQARAEYRTAAGEGSLAGSWGGAALAATAAATEAGMAGEFSIEHPEDGPLGPPFTATGAVSGGSDGWRLAALEVESPVGGGVEVGLSGTVLPSLDLSGGITATVGGVAVEGGLAVAGTGALPERVSLSAEGLTLNLADPLGAPVLRLTGRSSPVDAVALQSDLAWSSSTGFQGEAEVEFAAPGSGLRLELAGERRLAFDLSSGAGHPLAAGWLGLSEDPLEDPGIDGMIDVAGDLAALVPGMEPERLTFAGDLTLSGTIAGPRLEGPVRVAGAVAAAGELGLRPAGARLTLSGEELELTATLAGSSLSASAQGRISLAELGLPPRLAGLLSGRVDLSGDLTSPLDAAVDGELVLTDVTLPGLTSVASGTVEVTGTPRDPVAAVDLLVAGEAEGVVSGEYRLGERHLSLIADLAWRDFGLSTSISTDRGDLRAEGVVTAPGGGFAISSGTAPAVLAGVAPGDGSSALLLRGSGAFEGITLAIEPFTPAAAAHGALEPLLDGASGVFELAAQLDAQGRPRLDGALEGLAWRGVQLGDLRLSTSPVDGEVLVTGQRLRGAVQPTTLAWRVEELALSLPSELELRASGAGMGDEGRFDLLLAGAVLGGPTVVRGQLNASGDTGLAFSGGGELAGGSLSVDAALTGQGWSGEFGLDEAELGPLSASLSGVLSGPPSRPSLATDGELLGPGLAAELLATISPDVQVAELVVSSELLDRPLALRATNASRALQLELTDLGDESVALAMGDAGTLHSTGGIDFSAGPIVATIGSTPDGGLTLTVASAAAPGIGASTRLAAERLLAPSSLLTEPVAFTGEGGLTGQLEVTLSPLAVVVPALSYNDGPVGITLSGSLDAQMNGSFAGQLTLPLPGGGQLVPGLPDRAAVDFVLASQSGRVQLSSSGESGSLTGSADLAAGTAELSALFELGDGEAELDLAFDPLLGPTGYLRAEQLPVAPFPGQDPWLLTSSVTLTPRHVTGTIRLTGEHGVVNASGTWGLQGLLPVSLAPQASAERALDIQLGTFDLTAIPTVARQVPFLEAPLSGFLQIRGNAVVGRLVSLNLSVAGEQLPVSIDISGSLRELHLDTVVAGSPIGLTATASGITALATLDRFPLHLLAEAVTGPVDVEAEVTGVARLSTGGDEGGLSFEVATEQVRLERDGVITTGNLSVTLREGRLDVHEASFSGTGRWQARGSVAPNLLDLSLVAEDADFTSLLGLVPALAEFGVGAQGSLTLETSGTLSRPIIALDTAGLEVQAAGAAFRFESASARLENALLALEADVSSLSPVPGDLQIGGGGRLTLAPFLLSDVRFDVTGDLDVPWLGAITGFAGAITSPPNAPLWLEGRGRLGNPFTISGSLVPLDLTLEGQDLAPQLDELLLAEARVDARVRLYWEDLPTIGGSVTVDEALFALSTPRAQPAPGPAPEPGGETRAGGTPFRFDNLSIESPGRIRFSENFGSAEASLDLVLGGTSAAPALSGAAQVLRGTLRFSGREFTITSAVARFDPSRGILPILDATAVTSFDVSRVLDGTSAIRFVAPGDAGRFDVILSFTAEVEPAPGQSPPIRLDVSPTLSSEALIQVTRADGTSGAPRPLSESELLSLITLGRLELNAPLAGQTGLATAVAEGAIDTAVDLLFVSELQSALAEALGIDLVEIETTALSQVLGRSGDDPFSVSLRLGGYLSDEVFASYRIGTFDDVRGLYALTNEVNLVYDIGPLELDLAGRINFSEGGATGPNTELSASLRYDVYGWTGLEAGLDLSSERQQVRFGVTIRW